jgi:phosphopantetheinyl transferase
MGRVIVLHAPSAGHVSPDWEQSLLQRLPYARRLELERRDPESRRASLGGTALCMRAAARLGYGDVRPADLRFPQGAKPRVAGGPYFSVSHTPRRIACAASRECDLGFDHEDYAGEEPPARLTHWTAVEATLKAAGVGIERANEVEVDPGLRSAQLDRTRYELMSLELAPGVIACLAGRALPAVVEIAPLERVTL